MSNKLQYYKIYLIGKQLWWHKGANKLTREDDCPLPSGLMRFHHRKMQNVIANSVDPFLTATSLASKEQSDLGLSLMLRLKIMFNLLCSQNLDKEIIRGCSYVSFKPP